MTNFSPITFPQTYNIYGFESLISTDTALTVYDGLAMDNSNKTILSVSTTSHAGTILDLTKVGLNGIDTGALGASKKYGIYLIGDASGILPTGYIVSLSLTGAFTAPAPGPIGGSYDSWRLVGYCLTDSSSHLIRQSILGHGSDKKVVYKTGILTLSAGASASSATFSLDAAIPRISLITTNQVLEYQASVSFTPATAADYVNIGAASWGALTAATTNRTFSGVVAAKAQVTQSALYCNINGDPAVMTGIYINSAASGATSITVFGYTFPTVIGI